MEQKMKSIIEELRKEATIQRKWSGNWYVKNKLADEKIMTDLVEKKIILPISEGSQFYYLSALGRVIDLDNPYSKAISNG